MKNEDTLLRLNGLSKRFFQGAGQTVRAVEKVSFSVRRGEFFGVVGESGCGKSTLGRLILRLIEASEGRVFFNGEDITAASKRRMALLRPSMQMVFQNPFASFDPKMPLGASLEEVARFYGLSRKERPDRILELLDYINLSVDVLPRLPKELSGGQLQRLAIARSLITNPAFIVADEPVSALDVSVQAQLLNLLSDLKRRLNLTMLFISHDIQVVKYLCDRAAVMYMGGVVEIAGVEELFTRPLHPYTRALIASAPKLNGEAPYPVDTPDPKDTPDPVDTPDSMNPWEAWIGCRFAPRCPLRDDRCLSEPSLQAEGGDDHSVACHRNR
ncbi:MAG: ABC transporter ATP-binding protein [Treponema sp.]|jgi:oligopeptide/dipeptide ABC transporter ATP-binding protein|nr:ABC transporter ATP-binding protein [Treponema sp.]